MKRIILFAGVVLLLAGCASTSVKETAEAKGRQEEVRPVREAYYNMASADKYNQYSIDVNTEFQTIDGFGGGYTWYSDWIFMADKPGTEALDSLFSFAKMNILRFKNEFEYNSKGVADNAKSLRKYYEGAVERFAEFGEKPVVLMCCWSPAAYLKSNGKIEGEGGATLKRNDDGNYCYEEYADWWTRAVKYYQDNGVHIDYVSLQNEVEFVASYDGCRFDAFETKAAASYGKAFAAVYRSFRNAFGEEAPELLGPETMSCKWADIGPYVKSIQQELGSEFDDAFKGIAHHLYVGGTANENTSYLDPGSFMTNFMDLNSHFENTRKWQTEYYIGHALPFAELINNTLTFENANAFIYWGGVWSGNKKTFETNDMTNVAWGGRWERKAKYYTMRHFSEYIRPGYIRVKAMSGSPALKTSAYKSPDGKTVALVLINTSKEIQGVSFADCGFKAKSMRAYESVFGDVAEDEAACWINRGELKPNAKIALYPKSVMTVILK